jgi:hypothetical protein
MKSNVVPLSARGKKKRVDTIILTAEVWESFERPEFQRNVTVNARLRQIAEELKQTGVFPGILTIGVFDARQWVIDGQHRGEAFKLSGLGECMADVHYLECASMAEMADEFIDLNSAIVRFGADDVLRAMEQGGSAPLRLIRSECPWVGYGNIRRNPSSPLISMSATIRCWSGSSPDVPSNGGGSAKVLAESMSVDSAKSLARFQKLALASWGTDKQYARLWGQLNMTLSMWMFRRLVLRERTTNFTRTIALSDDQYAKCLQALSANSKYLDYLTGRMLNDDHRSPAYDRLRTIMANRLKGENISVGGGKSAMPSPSWASHNGKKVL